MDQLFTIMMAVSAGLCAGAALSANDHNDSRYTVLYTGEAIGLLLLAVFFAYA